MADQSVFKRSAVLALSCATILATAAANGAEANASTDSSDDVETVVVTGFRYSLQNSIAAKRRADGIVEAVSAEEIGKLPDVSIAENLARLPGLAAQRVDGRAQVLSLRGMAPKYAVTLLNGRELVSTGDNRSVEYDQFPSELINSATVYKTQDAGLASQGLSGTVNLSSVHPLDYSTTQISLNLRGEANSNGKLNADSRSRGGRASASYVTQFADNTIGLALGYAHLDNPGQEEYYKSWWWANTGAWGSQIPGLPADAIALQGFEAGVTSTKRQRDGVMAVLEFKPNDQLHSVADLYYSKFDQTSVQREFQSPITTWDGISYANPTFTTVGGDKIVTGGTISNANPVLLNRFNDRKDEVVAFGWNTEYTTDQWTLTGDLSYSKADRDEQNAELTAGAPTRTGFSSVAIDVIGNSVSHFTPVVDFSDASAVRLRDPGGWGRDGRSSFPRVSDEMKAVRFTAKRDLNGFIDSAEAGFNYSERSKRMNRSEVYYYLKNGRTPVALAGSDLYAPSAIDFVGIPGVVAFNFNRSLGAYYDAAVPAALDQAPGRRWGVDEKITRGFAKLNLALEGSFPVHGNVGVQVVKSDQFSSGFVWNGSTNVPITGGKTYTDVLPSLNLSLGVAKDTFVRLGLAKEMARPNIEDMRAGFSGVGLSATPPRLWSANGGNPWLEPWRAKAVDLSLEHYFGQRSYVSLAGFYKKLDTFVYNQQIDYDFTGFPNPTAFTPDSNIGQLSAPANGKGGLVKGLELSAAIEAAMLWAPLEGFGLVGSLSETNSSLHEENNPNKPLDGLSGTVTSLTLYYEKNGISARISERYRSAFQTTARNAFGDNVGSAIGSERIIDFQAGYTFSGGRLDGMQVLFQINNLNDEPYRTAVGVAAGSSNPASLLPERYNTYGRQYLLGISYKL